MHGTERIEYEIDGVKTRFNQVSAMIAPPARRGARRSSPGVTLYRVKNGVIDAGRFIPLDASRHSGCCARGRGHGSAGTKADGHGEAEVRDF